MTPIRALILDFDGVILDSNAIKTDAFREIFDRYPQHAAAMMDYHAANVSQSRFEKFSHLVHTLLGQTEDTATVDKLAGDFAALLQARMDGCDFVPGSRDLLEEFSPRIPLFLASVTPEPELRRLLDVHRIHQHFSDVFGCPPWNKPDAVGAIVERLGGPRGIALIGDSAGDQRAAAAHGVEFIARDSGLPFDPPVTGSRDIEDIAARLRRRIH